VIIMVIIAGWQVISHTNFCARADEDLNPLPQALHVPPLTTQTQSQL
jgi:hypothetical protein